MKAQCLQGEGLSARHRPHGAVARLRRQPAGDGAELRGRRGTDVSAATPCRRGPDASSSMPSGTSCRRRCTSSFSFNLIVFTTNLLVHDYWFRLSSFLLATTTALVVGKAVLVANNIKLIDRFRGAPLIQPILYKTIFYTLVVLVVRMAGALHPSRHRRPEASMPRHCEAVVHDFSWRRFAAIQIWIFICFLIYVDGDRGRAPCWARARWFRLFFRHRSSQHRLTRRQHVRALMELSRLAETTPREQLLDPATPQGSGWSPSSTPCASGRLDGRDEAAPPPPHPEERRAATRRSDLPCCCHPSRRGLRLPRVRWSLTSKHGCRSKLAVDLLGHPGHRRPDPGRRPGARLGQPAACSLRRTRRRRGDRDPPRGRHVCPRPALSPGQRRDAGGQGPGQRRARLRGRRSRHHSLHAGRSRGLPHRHLRAAVVLGDLRHRLRLLLAAVRRRRLGRCRARSSCSCSANGPSP